MRHGLIAGIAAVAIALAVGALIANWEKGFAPGSAAVTHAPMRDGRAATTTDPANPPYVNP
jgi:hypothetical protein